MVLARTSVHVVEQAPQNGCCQYLCPQGELPLPLASLKGSLRSARGSDQGTFQITPSNLGPRACKILCMLFKRGLSISQDTLASLKVSPVCACMLSHFSCV